MALKANRKFVLRLLAGAFIFCILVLVYDRVTWALLRWRIARDDAASVSLLLKINPMLVSHEYPLGASALGFAVELDQVGIARILIEAGADMYHEDGPFGFPCNRAARHGSLSMVMCFVQEGYNIEYQGGRYDHGTCLFNACAGGNPETVKYLIEMGAKVDKVTDDDGMTPLMGAICDNFDHRDRNGQVETVRLLLRHGARIDLKSKAGQTVMDYLENELSRLENVGDRVITHEPGRDYFALHELGQLLRDQTRHANDPE
ncbi:MAG: ankyrin repeat domain-containing protein [Deltaproteobacteria bacterium]